MNAISSDTTDYATLNTTLANCAVSLAFTDNLGTYSPGTFAGVEIGDTSGFLGLFNRITIQTY
jgi:hypothetical protein